MTSAIEILYENTISLLNAESIYVRLIIVRQFYKKFKKYQDFKKGHTRRSIW